MEKAYECQFCHKQFVKEQSFLNHSCKRMVRDQELKTVIGHAAWHYYQQWMKSKRKPVTSVLAFIDSKYYTTFINFAKFVRKVKLPNPDKFIWLMHHKNYPPTMWTSNEIYVLYLDFLDTKIPPLEHAHVSIHTLLNYADKHSVDVENVFDVINPNEVIRLVQLRKLSPWLLLFSKKFGSFFAERFNEEQQVILEGLIHPEEWSKRKDSYPTEVSAIKQCVVELGI